MTYAYVKKYLLKICCLLILSNTIGLYQLPTQSLTIGNTSELRHRPTLLQFIVAVIIAFLWKPFLQKKLWKFNACTIRTIPKMLFLNREYSFVAMTENGPEQVTFFSWNCLCALITSEFANFFSAICYQIYEVRMHLPVFLLDFLQFMPAGTWVASKCYLSKSEIDFHQNNAWQLEIWPKSASRKKFEINWNYFFSHHFHCSRCQILQLLDIQEEIERQKFIRLIKKVCTAEVVVVVRPFLYYNIVLECVE